MGRMSAASRSKKVVPSSHPKYEDMIRGQSYEDRIYCVSKPPFNTFLTLVDAIIALKERKGSSRHAIKKHILATFKLPDNTATNARLKLAINRGVEKGVFSFVNGPSGTIKLVKKEPKSTRKTATPKKTAKKPAAKPKKSAAAKKTKKATKKTADKKTTRKKSSN
ncbi:2708_t:CDS:2 [Acaulospora morrowiae]|uniref:Histone H1 n=1 Tax=Acaulospora morrowiae TaxID=94023 RepID=A0A9N9G7W5_9GLOM|nr:2708_t:CDS:2 [Acaulospora morrowiae]